MKESFTVEEAAPLCQTSVWTLYRRVQEGKIRSYRAGGGRNLRIPRDALIEFLSEHQIPIPERLREPRTLRLLLVDDDETFCKLIARQLEQRPGYELQTAHSALSTGVALMGFRPQVMFLDIVLPDIDGRELFQQLTQQEALNQVKVIAISGMLRERDRPDLLEQGFCDFLEKPLTLETMLSAAERAVD